MPVHSTWLAGIASSFLGKRSAADAGVALLGCQGSKTCTSASKNDIFRHLWRVTYRFLREGGFESLLLRRICLKGTQNKKAPIVGSFLNQNGGGGGIRTLVTLYRPNGFRDRRIQPLCHPSAWGKNKAGSKACFGINWRRVRDLNPGDAFDAYTISNRAPSATRTTLR